MCRAPASGRPARVKNPVTRFDNSEVGEQHARPSRTPRLLDQHQAGHCPCCGRSVPPSELVLQHTHSTPDGSHKVASAAQKKFANKVPPLEWGQAERKAESVRHAQHMGARGMLWVCQPCNVQCLPFLEPDATGSFGRTVLVTDSNGHKIELLTKACHPTLDVDERTSFPSKQMYFANSASFPQAFENGATPTKEEMAEFELVLDVSTESARSFYKMPPEATRRPLGSPTEMMMGLELRETPNLSVTHISLALRSQGLAWYRKVKEAPEGEDAQEDAGLAHAPVVAIVSIKDFAPAPAELPKLSTRALRFNSGHELQSHALFYQVEMAGGEIEVMADREILGSMWDGSTHAGIPAPSAECYVVANGLNDFLCNNEARATHLSGICGYCGTSFATVPFRREHEFRCKFQPAPIEQLRRNSAARAAGFKSGVHCDRGLGGKKRLQHVYTAAHVKAADPVRLDEAKFVAGYLQLAPSSPAAPSCVRLYAARLSAAAQSVAAGPGIPGAEQEEQAEACPTNPRAGSKGSSSKGSSKGSSSKGSSSASPAPTTQQPPGTKRTSVGEVGTARERPVARRKPGPGPAAVAIATALATPGAGGAARRQAKGLGQSKAEALKTLEAAHVGDCFSMEFVDYDNSLQWTAGILERIEMPSTWTRGTSCWRVVHQTGDAVFEPMIPFDGGPGSVSHNFLVDNDFRVGPSGA